jgi:hypothetical protein
MQDLQLAFLRSGLANQDAPQDHAFFAALDHHAVEQDIYYVISGSNYATESILPQAWGYDAMDSTLLKAVHSQFGERKLGNFPLVRFTDVYPIVKPRREVLAPLNFIPYSKDEAIGLLERDFGWRYYGGKHYESRWTRFFQAYYLPYKFGYDKRKAHLSSLVVSGQLSRQGAMLELAKPLYDEKQLSEDKAFVAKKLGIKLPELEELIHADLRRYTDYPNFQYKIRYYHTYRRLLPLVYLPARIIRLPVRILRRIVRIFRRNGARDSA